VLHPTQLIGHAARLLYYYYVITGPKLVLQLSVLFQSRFCIVLKTKLTDRRTDIQMLLIALPIRLPLASVKIMTTSQKQCKANHGC